MLSLSSRHNWSIGHKREVDTWVRDQVGLELVQVDVEGAIESKRGSDRGDDCNCQQNIFKYNRSGSP